MWSRGRKGSPWQPTAGGMSMKGVVQGEPLKLMMTRSDFLFRLKSFEVSIQLLAYITLLGLIAFLYEAASGKIYIDIGS